MTVVPPPPYICCRHSHHNFCRYPPSPPPPKMVPCSGISYTIIFLPLDVSWSLLPRRLSNPLAEVFRPYD